MYKKEDFSCKCGCGLNNINNDIVNICNEIFWELNKYYTISSGCRCIPHNAKVGGEKNSSHTKGLACDLLVNNNNDRYLVLKILFENGINRVGVSGSFIHFDIDKVKPSERIWLY
jgi:uncharacterized protein YcbK (DUF882 family)